MNWISCAIFALALGCSTTTRSDGVNESDGSADAQGTGGIGAGEGGSGGSAAGAGGAGFCTPGEQMCDENVARLCNASGTAFAGAGLDCTPMGARCFRGVCETGLVAYWPFDEEEEELASDVTGNGNDGSVINGQWVTGESDGALELGLSAAYVDVGDKLNDLDVPFSVTAWVFGGGDGTILIASDADTTAHTGFWITRWATGWDVHYGDGRGRSPLYRRSLTISMPSRADVWVHIAAVVQGPTAMHLYMDGVEVPGTLSGTGGDMVYSSAPFQIGSRDFGVVSWGGRIDELRVYERALSAAEVARIAAP